MGETAWPVRPKMAHILNRPSIVDTVSTKRSHLDSSVRQVANLVKGLQKEKMQRRQTIHPQGDLTGLHEDLGTGAFFAS